MRVLVTGGAGMIGSHVADELLRADHEVTILDSLDPLVHPAGAPPWIPAQAQFVHGDVRDPAALDRALAGCDAVAHLAAFGGFTPEGSTIADVNCTGTARLFEAVRRSGRVAKVVSASSMAVYGEGWYACAEHGPFHGTARPVERLARGAWGMPCPRCGAAAGSHPIPEDSDLRPEGAYATSKHFTERLTLSEGRALGIGAVALRYFLTYGPRQSVHNPYSGIGSIFASRLLAGLPPIVYEDGAQTRDVVYVDEVARATRLALERPEADGRALNVARGVAVGVAEFARALARALGVPIEPATPGRYRPQDNRHMLGDRSALDKLGWRPTIGPDEGLARYVEWVRGLGRVEERFGRAEALLEAYGIVRTARPEAD